jgi:hypothetical protein
MKISLSLLASISSPRDWQRSASLAMSQFSAGLLAAPHLCE